MCHGPSGAVGKADHGHVEKTVSEPCSSCTAVPFWIKNCGSEIAGRCEIQDRSWACNGPVKRLETLHNLDENNKKDATHQFPSRECSRDPEEFVGISAAQSMSASLILTVLVQPLNSQPLHQQGSPPHFF